MQLTTMQDIAGCRAIVKEAQELDALIAACKQQWLNHELYDESDDYIARIPEKLKAIRERLGMTPMKSRRTLAQGTAQR